jgi:hypothetical protein
MALLNASRVDACIPVSIFLDVIGHRTENL